MPAVLLAGNACKHHLCCDLKLEPMTSLQRLLHHVITVWNVLRQQLLLETKHSAVTLQDKLCESRPHMRQVLNLLRMLL